MLEFHRDMIQIHRRNPALIKGSFLPLHSEYQIIAYGRFYRENKVVVVINNSQEEKYVSINVYPIGVYYKSRVVRIMETYEEGYNVGRLETGLVNGELQLRMKPRSASVFACEGEVPVIYCASKEWA